MSIKKRTQAQNAFERVCEIHAKMREVFPYANDPHAHDCNVMFVLLAAVLLENHDLRPSVNACPSKRVCRIKGTGKQGGVNLLVPQTMPEAVAYSLWLIANRYKHGSGKWQDNSDQANWDDFRMDRDGRRWLTKIRKQYPGFAARGRSRRIAPDPIVSLSSAATLRGIKEQIPLYIDQSLGAPGGG